MLPFGWNAPPGAFAEKRIVCAPRQPLSQRAPPDAPAKSVRRKQDRLVEREPSDSKAATWIANTALCLSKVLSGPSGKENEEGASIGVRVTSVPQSISGCFASNSLNERSRGCRG